MNNLQLFFTNKYIYIPFLLWLGIQAFKVIWDLVETKKFNFKRIMGAGGMPSSHSAVVTSIATLIGKAREWITNICIFCCFRNGCNVRCSRSLQSSGKQASVLNKIVQTPGLSNIEVHEKLLEALGHTPLQVFVGALIGIVAGLIF